MKKSLLNISLTIALSTTAISSTVWSTQVYSSEASNSEPFDIVNDSSNTELDEDYMYSGMGVGAATGTLIAGPVGLVIGGLIGAFVGSTQPVTKSDVTEHTIVFDQTNNATIEKVSDEKNSDLPSLQVALLGDANVLTTSSIDPQEEVIIDILTDDISLDVYFRSGSTSIESFYPARLAAIAKLMGSIPQLELHLDGYADRRGDKSKNTELANQRINNVRQQLISAGADESRIISKAFGEMKMVSNAGDLEAYTFDRKVVIRFERSTADAMNAMTTTLSDLTLDEKETGIFSIEAMPEAVSDISAEPIVANVNSRF